MTRSVSDTPITAEMAHSPVNLLQFARKAGRSLLSVIPAETLDKPYLKGPARIHYLCDPDAITKVLVTDAADFPKSQVTKNILGSAIGNGMILSEGQVWKDQRRRYAPLFAARNMPVIARTFVETGDQLGRDLAAQAGEVDIAAVAQAASLTDISRVMFSGANMVGHDQIRQGLARYTHYVGRMSLFDLMGLPTWLPRLKWLRSRAPVTDMRALARSVIEGRRAENRSEPQDFLDLMIEALREDHEEIDQTIDNLLTFVVAGHETAANTLAWGLYLLAMHPDMQDRIRAEVLAAETLDYEALAQMPLLDAHVKETLRLYPAAAFFARDVAKDAEVAGAQMRKGDALFLPIYALHRHRQHWDEPDRYMPERFKGAKFPRGQYIPFGDGPRVCIGAQYASTEIRLLLASVLRHVAVGLTDRPMPRPVVTITMHPEGPLYLKVTPL